MLGPKTIAFNGSALGCSENFFALFPFTPHKVYSMNVYTVYTRVEDATVSRCVTTHVVVTLYTHVRKPLHYKDFVLRKSLDTRCACVLLS
jgi:hypothetical protein